MIAGTFASSNSPVLSLSKDGRRAPAVIRQAHHGVGANTALRQPTSSIDELADQAGHLVGLLVDDPVVGAGNLAHGEVVAVVGERSAGGGEQSPVVHAPDD